LRSVPARLSPIGLANVCWHEKRITYDVCVSHNIAPDVKQLAEASMS